MKMILMQKGKADSGFEITEEMILGSLDTFKGKPIVLNKNQELKDYRNEKLVNKHYSEHSVGMINLVEYKDGLVIGEVTYWDEDYSKDKYDNWQIQVNDDSKGFNYLGAEVFGLKDYTIKSNGKE